MIPEIDELEAKTLRYKRDRQTIREAEAIIRQHVGSLRDRAFRPGIDDGSDDSHFWMPKMEFPRDEVEADHRAGKHATNPEAEGRPQLNCQLCLQRRAQFRRRTEMRRDIVSELGGHCRLCHEPVTNLGARFVRLDGGPSRITQMLQGEVQSVLAEARTYYALICPECSRTGGRGKVCAQEACFIPVGIKKRPPRSNKGKPRRRPGESLAAFRLRCGGKF